MITHLENENHNRINTIFNGSINNANHSTYHNNICSKINLKVFFKSIKL